MDASDPPAVSADTGPDPDADESRVDGRQLRRVRNIEAVRQAILELQLERAPLDLESVATRAGVTIRSIYRYHADLDAAVQDAIDTRIGEIYARWDQFEPPDVARPVEERIEVLLEHRLEMERLGRPLRNTVQAVSPDPRFDAEVRTVFAPEFDSLPDAERDLAIAAVCYLFRPRGIRALSEFPQHGGVAARDALTFMVRRLLLGGPPIDL